MVALSRPAIQGIAVGHVNPIMVDLKIMDTASDTSEDSRRAVVQVPVRRGKRLRIMGGSSHTQQIQRSGGDQEHSCHSF